MTNGIGRGTAAAAGALSLQPTGGRAHPSARRDPGSGSPTGLRASCA